MAQKVKVIIDPISNTMNLWWGDPSKAFSSEETNSPYKNDVVVKDKDGIPIGVEIIGLLPQELNITSLIKTGYFPSRRSQYLLKNAR